MSNKEKHVSVSGYIIMILVFINAIILKIAFTQNESFYTALVFTLPLLFLAIYDVKQKRPAVLRNYPVIGRLRFFLESIRPELRQYFFESDLDGKPFSRRHRAIVYQRAKNEKQTVAFGMQGDPSMPGHEWINHSIYPVSVTVEDLRVRIGNDQCLQPYDASIYDIGAMSYGALSKTAITALNQGAAIGRFAHNTGEGGISDYHLKGGDLIWQIGTTYFGCRTENGRFNAIAFEQKASSPFVKMIELKLSQGAKPGHGKILPATKNTEEIAAIRHVKPNTTVHSPAQHAEFDGPISLLQFLQFLRYLSEGKPVGFKLCIGDKQEFIDICKAIYSTRITPDFISVDGAEGGTGAAPLEFTDHVGMPLYEALAFVKQTLDEYQLSDSIKILAPGKIIITAFDILKSLSLGASACYSPRGTMFALGCIQALQCDSGNCPVGVATQNPALYRGLDPSDKKVGVAKFHANTLIAIKEMMEACGFRSIEEVKASKFFRRIDEQNSKSFDQICFSESKKVLQQNYQFLN